MSQNAKLQRDIAFDPKKFNIDFELQDQIIEEEQKQQMIKEEQKIKEESLIKQEKKIENLFIDIKDMFFEILDELAIGKNPFINILNNQKKLYTFSLLLIIFGGLLLFFSNLMINKEN